jgi:hypothetical protein
MAFTMSGIAGNKGGPSDHIPSTELFQHVLSFSELAAAAIHVDQSTGYVGILLQESSGEDVSMELDASVNVLLLGTILEQLQKRAGMRMT